MKEAVVIDDSLCMKGISANKKCNPHPKQWLMICAAILGCAGQFMDPIHGVISLVQEVITDNQTNRQLEKYLVSKNTYSIES